MIDGDCQGPQLGVSLDRDPGRGLRTSSVTLAGFLRLGLPSKTRQETLGRRPRAGAAGSDHFQGGKKHETQRVEIEEKGHRGRQKQDTNHHAVFNFWSKTSQ